MPAFCNKPTSDLYLLRISAENNGIRIVVAAQKGRERFVFTNIEAAVQYIADDSTKLRATNEDS